MRESRNFSSRLYKILQLATVLIVSVALGGVTGCSSGGGGGDSDPELQMTGYNSLDSAQGNENLSFYTEFPWFVNMTYQVKDEDNFGVADLGKNRFVVVEDGVEISPDNAELNIRKRDSLPPDYSYTLKTVLIIDNSPSSATTLDKIKEAAQVIIDHRDFKNQQLFAIIAYNASGDPEVFQGFTNDPIVLNKLLASGSAVGSIQPSYGTTNLYGAVIRALSLWENNHCPSAKSLEQGFVVALTDGQDTSSLYDIEDAIAARQDKQVITVAIGPDVPDDVLADLERLGNGDFYHVTEPDIPADEKEDARENLCEYTLKIQNQMIAYADAFYWLRYKSQTTSLDQKTDHTVVLSIKDNGNEGVDATISGTCSSKEFYTGKDGIYFDATSADPDGEDEKVITIRPGEDAATIDVSALTFSRNGKEVPQFTWTSGNENIVTVAVDEKDSSKATITVVAPGSAQIIVKDTSNNFQKALKVVVQIQAPAFEFVRYAIQSQAPWFVDATFQVRETECENNQWNWETDLMWEEFLVKENGILIDPENSELNLRKRDAIPSDYTYTLKTVLLIDNTPSIGTNNLDLAKVAAKAFVTRTLENNPADHTDKGPLLNTVEEIQQEIAIYTFDEAGDLIDVWQDFTTDKEVLFDAIDSIQPGYGPTNFYGGMIEALGLWDNDHLPRGNDTILQQGVLVAITDGYHSLQGFYSRDAVLNAIGTKQVITVGVGDDLVSRVSEDLAEFGNAGFYSVPAPGNTIKVKLRSDYPNKDGEYTYKDVTYTALEKTLMNIEDEIVDFANSFYWLNYKSYVKPASDCTDKEDVEMTIRDNTNTGAGSKFSGKFVSCNFFEGVEGKLYVNSTSTNPWGDEGPIELTVFTVNNLATAEVVYSLEAFTYKHENTPDYVWTTSNQNIVRVVVDNSSYSKSKAKLMLPANPVEGSVMIRVEDNGNSTFKTMVVNVEKVILSPALYYAFNGNTYDLSGNEYHGTVFGASLAKDRFGVSNSAYSFDGENDYIAISDLFYGSALSANMDTIDQISVCAWVKHEKHVYPEKSYDTIISFSPGRYFSLLSKEGDFEWHTSTASIPKNHPLISPERYDNGVWHHVCVSYDYSGTQMKKLYVDGKLIAEADISLDGPIGTMDVTFGFVGAESTASTYNGDRYSKGYFKGLIDDVMIFHYILPDLAIKALSDN